MLSVIRSQQPICITISTCYWRAFQTHLLWPLVLRFRRDIPLVFRHTIHFSRSTVCTNDPTWAIWTQEVRTFITQQSKLLDMSVCESYKTQQDTAMIALKMLSNCFVSKESRIDVSNNLTLIDYEIWSCSFHLLCIFMKYFFY